MKYEIAPIALAVSLAVMSAHTVAEEDFYLEEVVVTATKRAASLQEVPVTVTAFNSATIEDAGINTADDVAALTPSLTITTPTSPFSTQINIRGIGTSATDPALEPSVGVFVDGVYLSASGLGMSDLTDIERIEVLQGPQGTLYGKNTNAGAISIITAQPSSEVTEGYVEIQAGDYGLRKITASVSGPLTDTLAYRLSGSSHEIDGYIKNTGAEADLNDKDDWNLMGKLYYQPSDELSIILTASHVDREGHLGGGDATYSDVTNALLASPNNNDPFDYKISTSEETFYTSESDSASIVVDYDLDIGSIKSITAYNSYEMTHKLDADRTPLEIIRQNEIREGDSFSQELRFTSDSNGPVEYQAGLFYYDGTVSRGDPVEEFGTFGSDFVTSAVANTGQGIYALITAPGDTASLDHEWNTETMAVFSQATWHATERLDLTAGVRYTDEDKSVKLNGWVNSTAPIMGDFLPDGMGGFIPNPTPADQRHLNTLAAAIITPIVDDYKRNSKNTDWMLKASFNINEDVMVFASASTGTKSGGFNGVNGSTREEREFDDEDTMSYELGLKSTLLDSRLRANVTAFFTEITDYQQVFQLETGAGTAVRNEGAVEVSGIDLNIQALPLQNLTLEAGLLYTHKAETTKGLRVGNELDRSPELQGNIAATWVFPLADGVLYTRADYSFMGDHDTGAGVIQDRELFNLKMGWRNDNWNLSVWGKNLSDHAYAQSTIEPLAFAGMSAYMLAPPRTLGATVKYQF